MLDVFSFRAYRTGPSAEVWREEARSSSKIGTHSKDMAGVGGALNGRGNVGLPSPAMHLVVVVWSWFLQYSTVQYSTYSRLLLS